MTPSKRRELDSSTLAFELNSERIVYTIGKLERRIEERFPGAGLARACGRLRGIGQATADRLDRMSRPILWIRIPTWLLAAVIVLGLITMVWTIVSTMDFGIDTGLTVLQAIETGIQDAVFVAFGVAFLVSAENRIRRRQLLEFIRELRAIAHIVDMHQLTKDPGRLLRPTRDTESSPKRVYSRAELGRYLDYSSEMLSLTSKIAAQYAERFSDPVVLQAVDEVEALTTGLSSKIWQKIMILDQAQELHHP